MSTINPMMRPAMMKAMMLDSPNAPFRLIEVACPEPGVNEVLVRIHASGVNPLDTKIRAGEAAHARHALPGILGIDMASVAGFSAGAACTLVNASGSRT